jgi:hypothetical protein
MTYREPYWNPGAVPVTRTTWGQQPLSGFGDDQITPPAFAPAWIYNAALDRLNEKVRGSLDLSVDLAEIGSTRRMLRSLGKLERYVKGVGPKRWANEWLELQYGWMPLVNTIFGAADESFHHILNRLSRFEAVYRVPISPTVQIAHITEAPITVPVNIEQYRSFQGCKIGLALELPADKFDLARWTSLNPVSLAWERLPYSFVVDWVFDVGSYLRAFETALIYNVAFRKGYVTHWTRMNAGYTARRSGAGVLVGSRSVDFWSIDMSYYYYFCQMQRTKLLSYPFPRPPTFHVDMGWRRMISAAALLTQLLK